MRASIAELRTSAKLRSLTNLRSYTRLLTVYQAAISHQASTVKHQQHSLVALKCTSLKCTSTRKQRRDALRSIPIYQRYCIFPNPNPHSPTALLHVHLIDRLQANKSAQSVRQSITLTSQAIDDISTGLDQSYSQSSAKESNMGARGDARAFNM